MASSYTALVPVQVPASDVGSVASVTKNPDGSAASVTLTLSAKSPGGSTGSVTLIGGRVDHYTQPT
jgi:hypothetical protein